MVTYSIVTSVIGISSAAFILLMIKKHQMYVNYTIWWLCVSFAMIIFGIKPQFFDSIVKYFGVSYPPTLLFLVAILFLFIKILFMDIERTKHEIRIRRLVQRVSILQAALDEKLDTDDVREYNE